MPEIQNMSIRHEAILHYLMAHPTEKLGDVARYFGVTQPWLSQIIHSDIFQARLREQTDIAFHHTVLPLREKMMAAANIAMDKLIETLPNETETRVLSSVSEGLLDRLGFGTKVTPPPPNGGVNVTVNVLRSELEEARALLGQTRKPMLEVTIDGERSGIALPLSSSTEVGSAYIGGAPALPAVRSEGSLSEEGIEA